MKRDQVLGGLALVVSGTVIGAVIVTGLIIAVPGIRGWFVANSSQGYRLGEVIDVPASVFAGSARTVLLFVRHDCEACVRSQVGFRRMVEEARAAGAGVRLVAPTEQAEAQLRFATQVGIADTEVAHISLKSLRLTHVPTVVVVERGGLIRFARIGEIIESNVESTIRDVLEALR